jgi:hypothetical protein
VSIQIVIHPAPRSPGVEAQRYIAKWEQREVCVSRTPFFAAARVLVSEGMDPETPLAMSHAGNPDTVCMRAPLGTAAGLAISESRNSGLQLRRFTARDDESE